MQKNPDNIIRFEKIQPPTPKHPPLVNLPRATKYLAASIVIAHILLWGVQFLAPQFNAGLFYYDFGFVSAKWTGGEAFTPRDILSLVTVNFLHGGWFHLAINAVTLVAFGAGVEKRMSAARMAAIFFLSSALALFVHLAVSPHSANPVIGASGGISGLFGAVLIMLKHDKMLQGNQRLLPMIVLWIVISAAFGVMGGPDGSSIAWVAHIGGFVAGLGLSWWLLNKRPDPLRRV